MARMRQKSITHNNCKCSIKDTDSTVPNLPQLDFTTILSGMLGYLSYQPSVDTKYIPERILKSGTATIVFWKDGSKTIVKLPEGDSPDDYSAFTAALAKKVFGSNSKVKKVMKTKTEVQKAKKGDSNEAIPTSAGSFRKD